MSAAFTPGPWAASHGGPRSNQWTVWADGGGMGDQRVAVMPYELIAQCGNANLIAAAPRMYESLDETHKWVRRIQDVMTGYLVPDGYDADEALSRIIEMLDGPEQREIQGRAFAALGQARGEQSL